MSSLIERLPEHVNVLEFKTEADWLAARLQYLTASEGACLFEKSPYNSPYSLAMKKLGRVPEIIDDEKAEAFEWAHDEEALIAKRYAKKTGRRVELFPRFTIVTNPEFPFLCAAPDALVEFEDGTIGAGELKNPNEYKIGDWTGEKPIGFLIQNQIQLMCCGLERGFVAAKFGSGLAARFVYEDTESHYGLQALICTKAAQFMADLANGIVPEPDGHDETSAVLKVLHPKDNGERIALPRETEDEWTRVEEIREQVKALEAEKEAITNRIKAAIGDNTIGYTPNMEFSWKHQGGNAKCLEVALTDRSKLDKAGIRYEVKYTPESRVLRAKKRKA